MGVKVRQKVRGKGKPWWVFVSHNGKRTSKQVGDKGAAEKVASEIRARLQLGKYDFEETKPKIRPLFSAFAEGFMDTYSAMHHKPSTRQSYRGALDRHVLPFFGDKYLNEITRKDVKEFIALKRQEGLSPATVRNLKAYLSAILADAVDDEWIVANPASRTGRFTGSSNGSDIAPLSWEEKAKLEEALEEHYPRHYPLFLTAFRTGMRIGELIALQPGDLDFNGGFIEVRRAAARGRITTPKNGKGRRVDMSKGLALALKAHLTRRKKEALKRGWGEPPEWLFYNEEGGMIDINNVRKRVFYKALDQAELRRVRVHDLRHTYATLRIAKGDNIADVSNQLGHSSVKITLDIYYHWMPGGKKDEVDELDGKAAPVKDNAAEGAENAASE